jgi:transcriptional regulator GlxA family with amidase domain
VGPRPGQGQPVTALIAFVVGLMWGASLTILWFWAREDLADSFDEHWRDNRRLFEDDDQ